MGRSTIRLQLEVDEMRYKKFLDLEKSMGAVSHSEAVRRLIDFGVFLKRKAHNGEPIDQDTIRSLFFTNLES